MDLSKIISVAGKSGLYRVVASGRQAIIAESLSDGKRIPVPLSVRVSSLEEISMFTTGDDVPLSTVLEKLHAVEKGGPSLDPKSEVDVLFSKLGEALPEHDRERIYPSDLRKLFSWYADLLKAGVFKEEAAKGEDAKEGKDEPKAARKGKEATGAARKSAKAADKAAPKPGAGSKPKASTTVRKGSQRGS